MDASFAHEWPGTSPRHEHHHHHHHRADWVFAKARAKAAAKGKRKGKGRYGLDPEHLEELIAMRQMRGGPFGGGPGGPFGPGGHGPFGHGPRGRGRGRARRGDVRLALLRLLGEEPRNGYQLMQTIEERSGGVWRPSPGSVYPTLSQLEDEGLVRSVEADGARRFEITDTGRQVLEERSEEPDPWDSSDREGGHPMRDVRPLIAGVAEAAVQVARLGDEAQRTRAFEILAEARRSLYGVLAQDPED